MFGKVLVANRGEIAVRVIATLRALGIGSVAVYNDAGARHVREADVAIRIGPAPAAESYLHIGLILEAAGQAGAGLVFIGPPAAAIEAMGDKIRAKATVAAAAGVPVVPGAGQPGMSDADLTAAEGEVGFPLLIKPSAGGGKGMRLVRSAVQLADNLARAKMLAGEPFKKEAAIAKLVASNAAMDNARDATQIFGGYGFMNKFPRPAFTATRRSSKSARAPPNSSASSSHGN
jgi:acetyl-CoA/propionyl-CoA carboxylase, biotin carboxylase, biotin carboxyl carrier protein